MWNLNFNEIENRLVDISKFIQKKYPANYQSKFILLAIFLLKRLGLTNIIIGDRKLFDGSTIKIKTNPLDFIITNDSNDEIFIKIFKELKNLLSSETEIKLNNNRITIDFNDERVDYSIIYIGKNEFERIIPYYKSIPKNLEFLDKAITLLNFWNKKKNYMPCYPYTIEYCVISYHYIDKLIGFIEIFSDEIDYEYFEIIDWFIYKSDILREDLKMLEEENLQKLANKLAQESQEKYDSRFISVVHTLQNNMQISEVRRGGSRAKLTHNVGLGDLDIIFTFVSTDLSREEIFKETERILRGNFENTAEITPKKVAIHLKFKDDIELDVVYLPYDEYTRTVQNLQKIKSANKLKRDAIRLIKYWNEEANTRRIKPMHIEDVIIGWNYTSLYDNITQYGEYSEVNMQILSWLRSKL